MRPSLLMHARSSTRHEAKCENVSHAEIFLPQDDTPCACRVKELTAWQHTLELQTPACTLS